VPRVPLVSVIVPVYNTEAYLRACLDSVAAQTVEDLEVIVVDDGSTDGSAAIASEFAARDPRFRLVTQPNGGLGNARNNGADVATGEFLAFVDSDDVLPRNAYELLLEPLRRTGSDFATGNVHRLTSIGTSQTRFLAKVFIQDRPKTHITRFRPLLADRIVPNKLWRRSFWEANKFRFPEGMVHEDIPVVLPAQFAARSVDVVAAPVYLYRIREGMDTSDQSITQRRLDRRALTDRVTAVTHVRDYLAREGPRKASRWYEQSVVAEDLMYFLNVLDNADDEYREVFLDRVNGFLDGAGGHVYDELMAIDRLKWHLVRRRLMPALLEVLRFQKERMRDTPPVRVGRKWYGDYPFRTDRTLAIPGAVYRLDKELSATPHVDDLRWDGDRLVVEGYMFISGIGAPSRESQRVSVTLLRRGRLRAIRQRIAAIRLRTTATHRPDATANSRQALCDLEWSGFVATLDPRKLRRLGSWRDGAWDLYVTVRAGGVTRRRVKFALNATRPIRAIERHLTGGVALEASPTDEGEIALEVRTNWAAIGGHRLHEGVAELSGELHVPATGALTLRAVRRGAQGRLDFPVEADPPSTPAGFRARVPLAELGAQARAAETEPHHDPRDGVAWDLFILGDGRRYPLAVANGVDEALGRLEDFEFSVHRSQHGDASLVARAPHAVVTDASWTEDGALVLRGDDHSAHAARELVLHNRHRLEQHVFPLGDDAPGRFEARLTPARVPSPAGQLPLREGVWELFLRPVHGGTMAPVVLAQSLYERLPLRSVVGHKAFALGMTREQHATIAAHRDLGDGERGGFHQRRLRETAYAGRRARPLRDAVVYSSFSGRQYSDNPRAIHEELVRRDAPVEHLWVVRDGMFRVPPGATALRDGSHEHYEAFADARFIVTNDHFPEWFTRRPDQICVQTWHGTPLKRLGFDMLEMRKSIRRAKQRWREQAANWQFVISPNRFSTPLLQRAYAVEGELLETGYPRDDQLSGPDREELGRQLRQRLGIPEGVRVVLYAPTYRDHIVDSRGRYRLDLHLDVDRLRRAIGGDSVVLFRKHHRISDVVPATADGFVRDASSYPDGTELLLAADVLVTDYSSMMFDFANTGRPMLFFTYDLETYRDQVRGFYFDFPARAPGPLLRTTDELGAALSDVAGVRSEYADRYAEFVSTFCELDDGLAAARVVDRVFSPEMARRT
jgi:CDP-glycerol glycerophosphotransferase